MHFMFQMAATTFVLSGLWLLGLTCILAVAHPQQYADDNETVHYQTDSFFLVGDFG